MEIPKFLYHGTTMYSYNLLKRDYKIHGGVLQCFSGIDDGALDMARKRAKQEMYFSFEIEERYLLGIPVLLVVDSSNHDVRSTNTCNIFEVLKKVNQKAHIMIDLTKRSPFELYNLSCRAKELSDFLF